MYVCMYVFCLMSAHIGFRHYPCANLFLTVPLLAGKIVRVQSAGGTSFAHKNKPTSSSPTASKAAKKTTPLKSAKTTGPKTKNKGNESFPVQLMQIISDPANKEAIDWILDGQAFVIHNGKFRCTSISRYLLLSQCAASNNGSVQPFLTFNCLPILLPLLCVKLIFSLQLFKSKWMMG